MPDKTYWDKKKQKKVILPSDYFECNRCLHSKFSYEINYLFQSGESKHEFKQTCLSCGETFFTNKKYCEDEKERFVLLKKGKKVLKEDKNEVKTSKK
jgi:hypothetical protein